MSREKPLYTFAIKEKNEVAYVIPSNIGGIPVHCTVAQAEQDFRMFAADKKLKNLDCIAIEISNLIQENIISRTFGEGTNNQE